MKHSWFISHCSWKCLITSPVRLMKLSYPTLLISYMFVFDIYVKVSHAPSFFFFYHSNTRVSTLVFFSSHHVLFLHVHWLQISFSLTRFLYNVFTFSVSTTGKDIHIWYNEGYDFEYYSNQLLHWITSGLYSIFHRMYNSYHSFYRMRRKSCAFYRMASIL